MGAQQIDTVFHIEPGVGMINHISLTAQIEMAEYLAGQLRERQQAPRDDMITDLAQAEITDDDGTVRRLDIEEGALFAMLLISAGTETVARLIGWSAVILDRASGSTGRASSPTVRSIPNAVEELLRLRAAVARAGTVDHRRRGSSTTPDPEGLEGAAADRFGRSRRAQVPRCRAVRHPPRPRHHVSFGYGVHFCIGAALARLEGRVALGRCSTATRAGRSTKPTAVDCTPAPCAVGSTSRSPSDDGRHPGGDCDRGRVRLDVDGPIAVITNDNPEKHNAFDDDMDQRLFADPRRAAGRSRGAGRHLAGRGQVLLVGPRRRRHRRRRRSR